jgi:hypothetical protein
MASNTNVDIKFSEHDSFLEYLSSGTLRIERLESKINCGSNEAKQQYFSSIVVVSFIGGGNRSTRRKPPSYRKSLTNIMQIYHVWEGFLRKILNDKQKVLFI